MLAMQYSFILPADYDMSIIDRRVREKGAVLDHHKPLRFKAYLSARKGDTKTGSHENLYAPFYLWHDNNGMSDFLAGPGFQGLVGAFGWPSVRIWPGVITLKQAMSLENASFASRETLSIQAFSNLEQLHELEHDLAEQAVHQDGAKLALTAFEPTSWSLVRFRLWPDRETLPVLENAQWYNVLHVSHPA